MNDHAQQKRWYHLIENIEVYLYTKNELHKILHFKKIPQIDWSRAFWPVTQEPEFCQIIREDIHTHVATISGNLVFYF